MKKQIILIANKEIDLGYKLKSLISSIGGNIVYLENNGLEIIARIRNVKPDLIIMSLHLNGKMTGVDVLECIKNEIDSNVIFLAKRASPDLLKKAIKLKPLAILKYPYDREKLENIIIDRTNWIKYNQAKYG